MAFGISYYPVQVDEKEKEQHASSSTMFLFVYDFYSDFTVESI